VNPGRCSGRGGGGRSGGPGEAAIAGVRFWILMAPPHADPSSFACPRDRVGWVVPLAGGCSLLSLSLCRCQVPTRHRSTQSMEFPCPSLSMDCKSSVMNDADEAALKRAVYKQPVSVLIGASGIGYYSEGIFTGCH
jgi:hypothetical protein